MPFSVIASIFCNKYGILLIDYLPKGHTINAEYYLVLLVQLKDILNGKRLAREGHKEGLVLARQRPDSPGTCNPQETYLPGLPMALSHILFSGFVPVGLPTVPRTKNN
jgi:hypothetical protein